MIKDIINSNEGIFPNDKQMNALKEYFPACFNVDGSFDIERFKEYLNDKLTISNEGYELKFLGKNYARLLASIDTTTVIVPDEEHNNKPENMYSENIYISGDNLDGLKQLLKSYANQVKCIYIDPPYNTGSDGFVYNDNFNFTAEELSTKLSIDEEQAQRILDLTKRGSASHSAWLMFMYPRLLLARDLLKDDGVIFISIDDNEQANCKLICDDIYGENNFLTTFIWEKRVNRENRSEVSSRHEYILCYAKNIKGNERTLNLLPMTEKALKNYSNPDNDPKGLWKSDPAHAQSGHGTASQFYVLTAPNGKKHSLPSGRCWVYTEEVMNQKIKENKIWFGKDGNGVPRIKTYLNDKERGLIPETILFAEDVSTNEKAKNALKELFDGNAVFDTPKPVELIKFIVNLCTNKDDYILDFFAGTSTTAHAVLDINVKDTNSCRKFILIQLNESISSDKDAFGLRYQTIDQIGIERILRVSEKIKKENPDTTVDLGFKHFILEEPKEITLDKLEKFIPEDQGMFINYDILSDFGTHTVLTTWLVHDGYGFNADVKVIDFNGYNGYYMDKHLYLIDPDISTEAIAAIVEMYETDGSFNAENVVLFGYSFVWSRTEELKVNLARLKDTEKNLRINFDVRY